MGGISQSWVVRFLLGLRIISAWALGLQNVEVEPSVVTLPVGENTFFRASAKSMEPKL
jgi:hypothetical protein